MTNKYNNNMYIHNTKQFNITIHNIKKTRFIMCLLFRYPTFYNQIFLWSIPKYICTYIYIYFFFVSLSYYISYLSKWFLYSINSSHQFFFLHICFHILYKLDSIYFFIRSLQVNNFFFFFFFFSSSFLLYIKFKQTTCLLNSIL